MAGRRAEPPRVTRVPGGPVLMEGPIDLVLPDGTEARSERPMVAICACRRSACYPFCDTSHRQRASGAQAGSSSSSDD